MLENAERSKERPVHSLAAAVLLLFRAELTKTGLQVMGTSS